MKRDGPHIAVLFTREREAKQVIEMEGQTVEVRCERMYGGTRLERLGHTADASERTAQSDHIDTLQYTYGRTILQ
jgi:phage tail protein X